MEGTHNVTNIDNYNNIAKKKRPLDSATSAFKKKPYSGIKFRPESSTDNNKSTNAFQYDMDVKRLRRIILNRISARKGRMKKRQYVAEMERKVRTLQVEIEGLSPQLSICKRQHRLLEMEKINLTQQMAARTSKDFLTDAEIEANKAELERLRQLQIDILQYRLHSTNYHVMNWEVALPLAAASVPLMFDHHDQAVMSSGFDLIDQKSDHHQDHQYEQGLFDCQLIPNLNQVLGYDHKDEVNYLDQLDMVTREYDDPYFQANTAGDNFWEAQQLSQAGLIMEENNATFKSSAPAISQLYGPHLQNHDHQALNVNHPNLGDDMALTTLNSSTVNPAVPVSDINHQFTDAS